MLKKNERIDSLKKTKIVTKQDWLKFQELFENVYPGIFHLLKEKLPALTQAEIRLICLTKLKLNNKQMAKTLGVSEETVIKTRYRLTKKLKINKIKSIEEVIDCI
jgi:DNA-binding CsgD family transcriptional regulator